jgi:hypothetical protein
MFRRFGLGRVRGVEFVPLRFLRRRCGAEGLALDGTPLAAVCGVAAYANRSFTLLGGALSLGAFATTISIPLDSSSTVMPLPWPTYCSDCPEDAAEDSRVMCSEKFAGKD